MIHVWCPDLRVALNATCLNDRPSGAKQRFLGLYQALALRMPEVEFVVFEPADCRMDNWFRGLANVRTRPTPIPSEGRWRKLFLSSLFWCGGLKEEPFDVFEGFHLPLPPVPGAKKILTVHDVRRLHADWGWLDRTAFRHALTRAIRNADVVVTVSEAMKEELLPFCAQTPIRVIPNGLDASATDCQPSAAELESFRIRFALPDRYLLAVGHLEPRKNYPKLIEALAHLRDAGHTHHLLIVGNDSGERAKLEAQITVCDLKGSVTLASGLSDIQVRCAYALCELFVFPSTYEGFGIPILEAMAAERPMALSNIPVFQEISGGHSVYFSPFDAKDIAQCIERALSSKEQKDRLVHYGLERSKSYVYSAIASRYEELYKDLLN
jgi:glycosyltransferase involved in cell wall biosynthesis